MNFLKHLPLGPFLCTLGLSAAYPQPSQPVQEASVSFFSPQNPDGPLYRIGPHTAGLFVDYPMVSTAASGGLTYGFIEAGWDGRVRQAVVQNPVLGYDITRPVFVAGHVVPLLGPAGLYLHGYGFAHKNSIRTASAVTQAVSLSAGFVSLLKFAVGRRAPHRTDNPRAFTPARLEIDIHDPRLFWPSGHTASMFTMVAAWHGAQPNAYWVALIGYPAAAFTGWAMVDGNYHWLSDVVSGALIGWTIGWYIGTSYRGKPRKFFWQLSGTDLRLGYRL